MDLKDLRSDVSELTKKVKDLSLALELLAKKVGCCEQDLVMRYSYLCHQNEGSHKHKWLLSQIVDEIRIPGWFELIVYMEDRTHLDLDLIAIEHRIESGLISDVMVFSDEDLIAFGKRAAKQFSDKLRTHTEAKIFGIYSVDLLVRVVELPGGVEKFTCSLKIMCDIS